MINVFIESGYVSLNKFGEPLCGDRVVTVNNNDFTTIVLSDGLGSGVKANILSTLTAKIIATMMANNMKIEECIETIAETLPVCSVRKVAYSTFTILQVHKNGDAYVAEFDNPKAILIRDGKNYEYSSSQKIIKDKKIYESKLKLEIGDVFVLMSDGVIHAGVGELLNFGWQRENVVDYLEQHYISSMSAKTVASLVSQACNDLYLGKPGDDTTVAALKIKKHQVVNLMIGPPKNKADDEKIMQLYFSKEGKKIVCGGTTSQVVSKYLGKPVVASLDYNEPDIPPIASIEGIDLVTEGVITLGRVIEYAKEFISNTDPSNSWYDKKDGASMIARILFEEATDINFFVGGAINPSHQNPELPITISIKMNMINDLNKLVEDMGKNVKTYYY